MRRTTRALAFLAAIVTASMAHAGWNEFWEGVRLDWHRMNCWPEPFLHADKDLVRQPLIAMTDNGWRMQNTLSDHLFDVEEHTLTQAGSLKVRWIVTQAPPHRRTVFVLRGATPEATLARVDAVQGAITQLVPQGNRPDVMLTDVIPVGGSGDYFDAVDRQLKDSIPPPRLPQTNGPTGGNLYGAVPHSGSARYKEVQGATKSNHRCCDDARCGRRIIGMLGSFPVCGTTRERVFHVSRF